VHGLSWYVESADGGPEVVGDHPGIDLRGRLVLTAKERFYVRKGSDTGEKVGGEGVAKHMRGDVDAAQARGSAIDRVPSGKIIKVNPNNAQKDKSDRKALDFYVQ
jgi:hypothetical protein